MDGCSWPPYQARDGARAIFSGDMPWHKARYVRYDLLVSRDRSAQLDIATARCYDHTNNPSILISAWVLLLCGNSSCDDSDRLHQEREGQDVVIRSQLQQQLEQIYMLMDMEQEHELHLHHAVPPQSPSQQQRSSPSSSPPFRSFAVSSDETSSLVLSASSTTTTFCQQPAQASSLDTPFSPLPYSAFQHLRPKKIKTAMSVLAKMHSTKLSQWQRQSSRTEMTAAPCDESNNIQLQHLLSERKRREKINDSFDALRNALPPSSKRDKTSILMRARDYINSVKSKVYELEEKGMALESQLWIDYGDEQDVNGSPEKIEVGISRAVAEETMPEDSGKLKM